MILAPVEILQYFLIRPFTLGVRLFANMFAGHILLLIFTLATWYLASCQRRPAVQRSPRSILVLVADRVRDCWSRLLQAFIFTILTATSTSAGSLEAGH